MKDPKIKIIQNSPEGKQKPPLEVDTNAIPKPNPTTPTNNSSNQAQITALQNQYNSLVNQKEVYTNELDLLNQQLQQLKDDCEELAAQQAQQQQQFISTKDDCNSLSIEIEAVQQQLKLIPPSTVSGCTTNSSYNSLLAYLNELKEKYNNCITGAQSTNVTQYNTVFITQIYNTNEYEGNVTVIGDDEWDDNNQLINDCIQ